MLEGIDIVKKQLLGICDEMENADYIEKNLLEQFDLSRDKENLKENVFKVAFISTFSAGKSTFINSLLGANILGMDQRAWTATVTRISYSKDVVVEIRYIDGRVEHIENEYKGQKLTSENIELIRDLIENKTTVQGEGEECMVKDVIVKYPFELCRKGVEIIDTPGLGGYHEDHDEITNNILPDVNAVIFLLEPEKIGEREITNKIKNYVKNAVTSKAEKSSDYIFMVMNKADRVESEEAILVLRKEIHKVFDDTLKDMQLYDVSAYFALKARMVQNGYADIKFIQKDKEIVVTLPGEDDFICGSAWNMDNLNLLLSCSKMVDFEKKLGTFLEDKGDIFIVNLKKTISNILKNNISQLETRRNTLMISSESAAKDNNRRIKDFKTKLNNLKAQGRQDITVILDKKFNGGSEGNGLESKLLDGIDTKINKIISDTFEDIDEAWKETRGSLTQYSADDDIVRMMEEVRDAMDIHVKEFVKEVFVALRENATEQVKLIETVYSDIMRKIETESERDIGRSLKTNAENRLGKILSKVEQMIGNQFGTVISSIVSNVNGQVKKIIEESFITVKKSGAIAVAGRALNNVASFFGFREPVSQKAIYEEKFDRIAFLNEADGLIDSIKLSIKDTLIEKRGDIRQQITVSVEQIFEGLKDETIGMLKNEIASLEDTLEKMIVNFNEDKTEREKELASLDDMFNQSKALLFKLSHIK